jgi:hypothetical protein
MPRLVGARGGLEDESPLYSFHPARLDHPTGGFCPHLVLLRRLVHRH